MAMAMAMAMAMGKSKSYSFPDTYWDPSLRFYTYLDTAFHYMPYIERLNIGDPPRDGAQLRNEIKELLRKQQDTHEIQNRKGDIEAERNALTNKFHNALIIGKQSHPRTNELMNAVNNLALLAAMPAKKRYSRPRPNQVEPSIKPIIEMPGHPAYPSGHSTQNFLVAHALCEVVGDDVELIADLFEIARRVAENREWAGVHYSSDTEAGENLARGLYPVIKATFRDEKEKKGEVDLLEAAVLEWHGIMDGLSEDGDGDWKSPEDWQTVDDGCQLGDNSLLAEHWHLHNDFHSLWFERKKAQYSRDIPSLPNISWYIGMPEVSINLKKCFSEKKIKKKKNAPRVVLLDTAVELEHPSLINCIDQKNARNLDYPDLRSDNSSTKDEGKINLDEADPTKTLGIKSTDIDDRTKWIRGMFSSKSSAHGTACAGVIAASRNPVEPTLTGWTLGIAPHCKIVPYRAMTMTERNIQKRRFLAQTLMNMVSVSDVDKRVGDVLLCPLPFKALDSDRNPKNLSGKIERDPLPFVLHFIATKIPVVIPSGNNGTEKMSYLANRKRFLEFVTPKINDREELENFAQGAFGLKNETELARFFGEESMADVWKLISDDGQSGLISVGACNYEGRRSRYSQYGHGLTLVAPSNDAQPTESELGAKIEVGAVELVNNRRNAGDAMRNLQIIPAIATTDIQSKAGFNAQLDHYAHSDDRFGGTSAASAQVAGVIALMLTVNPNLKPAQVRHILQQTAQKNVLKPQTEETFELEFGAGLVDADAAVAEAKGRIAATE